MATRAADFLQKEGPDKAFAAFNGGGNWRDGDLYVFVIDKTGTWRSHGARPEVIGTKADLDKRVIKEILAIDKNGWVDYKLKSPADNQVHDKSTYLVRVGDLLVGAGACNVAPQSVRRQLQAADWCQSAWPSEVLRGRSFQRTRIDLADVRYARREAH